MEITIEFQGKHTNVHDKQWKGDSNKMHKLKSFF